jgi:hypothetical protein
MFFEILFIFNYFKRLKKYYLQSRENYEDLVSCSVCYEVFDGLSQLKTPKTLPCQHTYCSQCIQNLIKNSPSESKKFNCPQCMHLVENVSNSNELPTSRIVLSLLEKSTLNFSGFASCPSCRQIKNLLVCFECNLPLCLQVSN